MERNETFLIRFNNNNINQNNLYIMLIIYISYFHEKRIDINLYIN